MYISLIYIAEIFNFFLSKDEILDEKRRQLLCMRRRQYDVSGL